MPKTKISEYSATNSSNTDIEGINIDEGCPPSSINNAIRELMVHLKEFQTGASGDAFTFAGGTLMTGTNTISGAAVISGNINSSGTTNTFSGGNVLSGTNTFSGTNIFSSDVTLNAQKDLRFADSDSSNWVAFQAPATVSSNVTWTLPAADGTSNQVLATNGSGTLSWATAGGGASISAGDSKVEVTDTGSNGTVVFNTDNAERMRINSSGNVLVGTTTSVAVGVINSKSQIEFTDYDASQTIKRNQNDTGGPQTLFVKSRGASNGSNTVVQSGDTLGSIRFWGTDGSAPVEGATILAFVDGTPGANDMPGRLVFSTTADGSSSPTERARINSGGEAKFSTTGTYPSATAGGHQFRTNANSPTLTVDNNIGSGLTDTITQITLGYAANTSNSYFVYCNDSSAARMYVRTDGGIGNYSGNNVNLSDQREKKDFAPAKNYLDVICNIPVQTFNYIDQSEDNPGLTLGVVAQDVQAVAPELVMESDWSTEKDGSKMRLSIYQTDLQYALMKSIQELKAINDAQATRIETLEAQNAAFETRLAALEAN
jgi:hypothetical protein